MTRTVALVYIRKSVVRTARDELSPERQRAACVAYCTSRGWTPEVYEDAEGHRSGRTETHRPAWRELKRQLTRPDVVAVVANSLDRLSRSPSDFFNFLSEIQRSGVELVSLHEQFDTSTAIGRAFLAILMVVASLESDMASERVTATITFRKAKGLHWGNNPFGYDRDAAGVLVPNADAPIARACLEHYASGDTSFTRLARHMNTVGSFRDRDGLLAPWTRDNVRSVISNVLLYAGMIPNGRGKDFPACATLDEMIEAAGAIPGQHPAIIDPATTSRVLTARMTRHAHRIIRDKRTYPLAPILYCAVCGCSMRGKTDRRGPVYTHHGTTCNAQPAIPADALESAVIDLLQDALRIPDELVAQVRAAFKERITAQLDATPSRADLDKLTEKHKRLVATFLEGELTQEDYNTRRAELDLAIRRLEATIRPEYDLDRILDQLPALADLIRAGTPGQQRHALCSIFQRIEIADGEIQKAAPSELWRPFFRDLSAALRHNMPPREPRGALCRILALIAASVN